MITIRCDARRKGLRMAAQVAALSGVLAAAAAASQAGAAEAKGAAMATDPGANDGATADGAGRIGDLLRVSSRGGNCGCAPCWGPPAPPAMVPELFAMFDAEVAS